MTDCHVGCILNAICCAMYCILALASCIRLVRRRPVTFPTLLRILWRSTFFGRKRHHHHRNPLLSSQSSFMASGSLQFPSGTTPDGRQTTHRRHEGEEDEDETHDRASTNKQRRWPFVTSLAEWFSRNRKGDDDGATQGRRGDNSSSPCSSSATGTPSGSPNSHTTEPHRATSSSFPSGRGSSQVKSSFSRSLPFSPQALQQLKMSLMILSTLALYAAARSIEEGLLLSEHASVSSIDEYSYLVFSMFPAIGFMLLQTVLIYKWTTHTKDTLRAIRQETQGKSMMASSSSSPSKQYDTTVHTLTNAQQQPATRTGALLLGNHPTATDSSGYYPNGTGNAAAALSVAPSDAALWSHRSLPEGDTLRSSLRNR